MALLPSSSITYSFTYDVFLSFRGSDTRYGFTGNLHKTLSDKGIHTFIDDKNLNRGDEITPTLIKAIQESRILIPIFSVNYASSSFCLDELVTIMECAMANGRLVFPVFYDVDPSHIRHQRGTYAEALAKHEKRFQDNKEKLEDNMKRLHKWKTALNQAANLSGSHFKPSNESYEYEFIEKIVREVSRKINRVALHIADYPVGLDSRVPEVITLLDVGSDDRVHIVGIHGTGGIGKTTLALAVYNSIADHFEGLCFLENVRENYDKHGLLHLQKTLLLAVLGEKEIEITSVKHGTSIIQHRLQRKKVLLILDDVGNEEQLRGLVGQLDWFHLGSRVIITTRDKHLLACHGVKRTYEVEELEEEAAFNLLRWKAFKNDKVNLSYVDILNCAVAYASGLPLALEVIGSNMYGKSIQEWESALEKYDMIPDKKIQKILKVSFNALEEEEKSVFLDIACCFKGYDLNEVEDILHAHYDHCIKYQIGVLVDKSLIKIQCGNYGEVTLHDLIEDMGKEIVRQKSPNDPGKRSRLGSHEDIVEVLEEKTGTNKIEMICLDSPLFEEIECDGNAFKKMKNLRTLIIKRAHFSKGPKYLPNSLRVLEWWKYPSEHLPYDFHPKKLCICKLPGNCFTSLEWVNSSKGFVNLKVLRLKECEHLTHIHDISSVSNLEEFSFKGCVNLITIHNSVGLLNKLKILDARNCPKLRSVPPLKLPLLKYLELSGCSSLESFPELLEKMENLDILDLRYCHIRELPPSFQNLTQLSFLHVNLVLPIRSFATIPCLIVDFVDEQQQQQQLEMLTDEGEEKVSSMLLYSKVECLYLFLGDWKIRGDRFVALVLPYFDNLKELFLSGSNITSVPGCIKECRYLWKLEMDFCSGLREFKAIPPSLKYLSMQGCKSLNFSTRTMLLKQELHEPGGTFFRIPIPVHWQVPNWIEYRKSKHQSPSTFSFWFRYDFPDNILLCFAASPSTFSFLSGAEFYDIHITINDKMYTLSDDFRIRGLRTGHTCLHHVNVNYVADARSEIEWNHAEVVVEKRHGKPKTQVIADIGIHLLKEKGSMDNIRFTNPYCEENFDYESFLTRFDSDLEEYEIVGEPSDSGLYDNFDSDSWPSSTHSGMEENEDESSNYETPSEDFNSEWSLSSTPSEDFNSEWSLSSTGYDVEENERDDGFISESSLPDTDSDVEEIEGDETSHSDTPPYI